MSAKPIETYEDRVRKWQQYGITNPPIKSDPAWEEAQRRGRVSPVGAPVQNPLADILKMLFSQVQSRPDLQPMQTTPQAAAVGAVAGGMGQQPPAPTAPPVATFAGRVVQPGEPIQQILARPPLGEMEAGSTAMQAPAALGQAISSISLLSSIRNVAKGLKGKFPTAVVDKEGLPKVVYHGTPQAFGEFDISKSQPGLYGKGIYLTESPEIAGGTGARMPERGMAPNWGYATPRGSQIQTDAFRKQLESWKRIARDAAAVGDEDRLNLAKENIDKYSRELNLYGAERPNVRPVFVDIRRPFDIDAPLSFQEASNIIKIVKSEARNAPYSASDVEGMFKNTFDRFGGSIKGSDVWQIVHRAGGDSTDILKRAGYDGITHIGGSITGGAPHRVWIAFDPKQVKSVFDPTLQELSGYVKPKAVGVGKTPRQMVDELIEKQKVAAQHLDRLENIGAGNAGVTGFDIINARKRYDALDKQISELVRKHGIRRVP